MSESKNFPLKSFTFSPSKKFQKTPEKKILLINKIKHSDLFSEIFKYNNINELMIFLNINKRFRNLISSRFIEKIINFLEDMPKFFSLEDQSISNNINNKDVILKSNLKNFFVNTINDIINLTKTEFDQIIKFIKNIFFDSEKNITRLILKYFIIKFKIGKRYENQFFKITEDKCKIKKLEGYYFNYELFQEFFYLIDNKFQPSISLISLINSNPFMILPSNFENLAQIKKIIELKAEKMNFLDPDIFYSEEFDQFGQEENSNNFQFLNSANNRKNFSLDDDNNYKDLSSNETKLANFKKIFKLKSLETFGNIDLSVYHFFDFFDINENIKKLIITNDDCDFSNFDDNWEYDDFSRIRNKYNIFSILLDYFPKLEELVFNNFNFAKFVTSNESCEEDSEDIEEQVERELKIQDFLIQLNGSGKKFKKIKFKNSSHYVHIMDGRTEPEESYGQHLTYELHDFYINSTNLKIVGGILKDFEKSWKFFYNNPDCECLDLKGQFIKEDSFIKFISNIPQNCKIKVIKTSVKRSGRIDKAWEKAKLLDKRKKNVKLIYY